MGQERRGAIHEAQTGQVKQAACAGTDYRALVAQPSWRSLILASVTIAGEEDQTRVAALLVYVAGRERYQADPSGFSAWLNG